MLSWIFVGVLLFAAAQIDILSGCTMDEIRSCMVHLKTTPPPGHVFVSLAEPQFTEMCKEITEFGECVDSFLATCDASHRNTIHERMNRAHYLCNEGKNVYLKNYQCFGGETLNAKALECLVGLKHTRNQARIINPDLESRQDMCEHMENATDCLVDVVSRLCGQEAADMEREVMGHHYNPVAAFGGCHDSPDPDVPGDECSESKIRKCQALHIVTARPNQGQVFISVGEPEFSNICKELEGFEACLAPFKDSCDDINKGMIHKQLNRMHYMCNDGRQTYLKHHECFGGAELNENATVCAAAFSTHLMALVGLWQSSKEEDRKKVATVYCSSWTALKVCTYHVVEQICGKEAAEFEVNGVMGHHYNLSRFIGGCDSGNSSTWIIVGCVVGGFALLLVIGGVLAARVYQKRRKANSVDKTFDNPLENAYDLEKY